MIISDPTTLITGGDSGTAFASPISIDTGAKTITITPGSGILPAASDGVTFQALYSACKLLWKNSSTLVKIHFPFESITSEQYEIKNGWTFANSTTRKAIRNAGWEEKLTTDNTKTVAIYSGIISLGTFSSGYQAYYQQALNGVATNFSFTGAVNEAIQVLSDPNGDGSYVDGFDRRTYLKLYTREEQKHYVSSSIDDIGVSSLSSYAYRFPLSVTDNSSKVSHTDAQILADSNYDNIDITWYGSDQTRTINGVDYYFRVIIEGDGKTLEQIYEKVQYLLRRATDIDEGAGTVIGKTANELLTFVGNTLVTSQSVYIDNFDPNDTNRIELYDQSNNKVLYPYTASGNLLFNENLVNDVSAKYWMFFTTNPGGNYGTTSAIIVKDADGVDITGTVSGASIPWSFSYDSNVQGGRTAATDAAVTVVAIGLSTGQYVSTTSTITRTIGQAIALAANLERNYVNP